MYGHFLCLGTPEKSTVHEKDNKIRSHPCLGTSSCIGSAHLCTGIFYVWVLTYALLTVFLIHENSQVFFGATPNIHEFVHRVPIISHPGVTVHPYHTRPFRKSGAHFDFSNISQKIISSPPTNPQHHHHQQSISQPP